MSLFTRAKKRKRNTRPHLWLPHTKGSGNCLLPRSGKQRLLHQGSGGGCSACHELYLNTQKAALAMGLDIETEYVTDLQKVMEYGVMSMPALVINDRVVSMGKVLKPADLEQLLRCAGL